MQINVYLVITSVINLIFTDIQIHTNDSRLNELHNPIKGIKY